MQDMPDRMSVKEIEIDARLTLHEFLLELAFANAFNEEEKFEQFRKKALELVRYRLYSSDKLFSPADADRGLVHDKTIEVSERFFEKVASRRKA